MESQRGVLIAASAAHMFPAKSSHEQPWRASGLPHMAGAAQCPQLEQPRAAWRASEASSYGKRGAHVPR